MFSVKAARKLLDELNWLEPRACLFQYHWKMGATDDGQEQRLRRGCKRVQEQGITQGYFLGQEHCLCLKSTSVTYTGYNCYLNILQHLQTVIVHFEPIMGQEN